MDHPALNKDIKPYLKLKELVKAKALQRLKYEGLDKDLDLTDPSSPYCGKPAEYAIDRFAYYPCYRCKVPDRRLCCGGGSDCCPALLPALLRA